MIIDIINKYKDTNKVLDSSYSHKRKLIAIIDFFKECERLNHFPPSASFVEEYTPLLINIFKSSSINFVDPEYLNSAKVILGFARETYKDEIVINQIETVLDYINMQLLKLYFYLGEFKEGLVILKKMVEDSQVSIQDTGLKDINFQEGKKYKEAVTEKHSLVSVDFFKKSRAIEILEEIKSELDRMNSFTKDDINVLLVEEVGKEGSVDFGNIQTLHCNIQKSKKHNSDKSKFVFENVTDIKDDELQTSLNTIEKALRKLLPREHSGTFDKLGFNIGFNNLVNVYKGSSFLFPAAIISYCRYFEFTNNIVNHSVNSSAAFSGSLDDDGNLLKLSYESLKAKINAAFFSWIKYIIIPNENKNEAGEILNKLYKKYPYKKISVIGISNVSEVQDYTEIIKKEKDALYNHAKKFVKRNSISSGLVISIIMLIAGFFLASNFIPKDIRPLPRPESDMYLIYAPDRDTSWIFHNENYFGGDTIDFGDVAIGDQWSPLIEFWNNSSDTKKFDIYFEGKNKEEFELAWVTSPSQREAPNIINTKAPQHIFVKFVPHINVGLKTARLVFSSNEYKENKKTIFLKGSSNRYEKGYSLNISDYDDDLVIDPGENILKDDFTFSVWIKPNREYFESLLRDNERIIAFDNNPLSNNKFALYLGTDSLLNLMIYGSKAYQVNDKLLISKNKLLCNIWNYIAITCSKDKIFLILNDQYVSENLKPGSIRKINDCIYFSKIHPSDRATEKSNQIKRGVLIDELKINDKYFEPNFLIENRHGKPNKNEYGLLIYYDFDECMPKRAFDKTPNDVWGKLYGGVNRILENAPLEDNSRKTSSVNSKNTVMRRFNNGLFKLNKNIFSRKTNFTIQFDRFSNERNQIYKLGLPFIIMQPGADMVISLNNDSVYLSFLNPMNNIAPKFGHEKVKYFIDSLWHRYTLCYSFDEDFIKLYIDGKEFLKMDSITSDFDVSRYFMGLAFGNYSFFAAPRYYGLEMFLDNIKIYERVIDPSEIFGNSKEGLLAYWTFENSDNELVYDEVSNLPAILLGDCELVNEEIPYLK